MPLHDLRKQRNGARIVEALRPGVQINTLDHFLNIDDLLVLRRRELERELEDALAGVQAGRRGRFGLVIGVDRGNQAAALQAHGAHLVTSDLRTLLPGTEDRPAAA